MKKIWIGAIVIILIIIAIVVGFGMTGFVTGDSGDGEYSLAKCLTENGAVMYGTDWCSYCQRQKALFGNSFGDVTFINCDYNRDECVRAGVQGYPTWKINEQNYPGVQSLEKLASLTGCEL